MIKLDKSRAHVIEEDICPPMTHVATIPVEVDGHAVTVYVCIGPWGNAPKSGDARRSLITKVVDALAVNEDLDVFTENAIERAQQTKLCGASCCSHLAPHERVPPTLSAPAHMTCDLPAGHATPKHGFHSCPACRKRCSACQIPPVVIAGTDPDDIF